MWTATVAAAAAGVGELTLTEALLLLAVLVIVPAALPLHPALDPVHTGPVTAAAVPTAPALLVVQGPVAAAMVVPWVVATGVVAAVAAWSWWTRSRRPRDVVWAAAAGYLVVGSAWLFADRLDLEPAGFAAPFVQLTAVHFHYAGFVAVVFAACAWRWRPDSRAAAAATLATVAAPPIVAVGFTAVAPLQIVGAVLLTVGLWLLAWVTVRHVAPDLARTPAVLLVVSALATVVPMALAVQWAVGANYGTPALSIPMMVRTHGVANAVGFALLGVVGWRLAAAHRARQVTTTATDPRG